MTPSRPGRTVGTRAKRLQGPSICSGWWAPAGPFSSQVGPMPVENASTMRSVISAEGGDDTVTITDGVYTEGENPIEAASICVTGSPHQLVPKHAF